MKTIWKLLITIGSIGFIGAFFFWIFFLNHTTINEIGIQYNSMNGEITTQLEPGWYITNPMTKVAYVSTLPIKITIPSEAKVIVSKIVAFNPSGVKEFIRMQGFSYHINSSLHNVLLGYAFSGSEFEFLDIMQETTEENTKDLRHIDIK